MDTTTTTTTTSRLSLTPTVNRQLVDALFAFVEKVAPTWAVPMLEALRLAIDSFLPALSAYQAMRGVSSVLLTGDDLGAWVDSLFDFIELKLAGEPLLGLAVKMVHAIVKSVGVPKLVEWLKSLGLLTA